MWRWMKSVSLVLVQILDAAGRIERKIDNLGVTMARIDTQLDTIQSALEEASTEIPQLITDLRDALGEASPEIQAKLDLITAKAQALAGIVPNSVPEQPETEEPVDGGDVAEDETL